MTEQSTAFKFILIAVLVFGVGTIIVNFISYSQRQHKFKSAPKTMDASDKKILPIISSIFNKPDFKSYSQPATLTNNDRKRNISKIPIPRYKISIDDDKHQNIFVRSGCKGKYPVLFLHDQKSSSKIWEKIGTLQYLCNWGYRALAIDFPSNGNSLLPVIDDKTAVQWLTKLIRKFHLSDLVIISPAISSQLILPYIFKINKQEQKLIRGFVSIDAIGADKYPVDNYKQIKIPTLIIHGENNTKFQSSFDILKQIPTSEVLVIKNSSHNSYCEQPIDFHNGLRQFLYKIYRPIYRYSL